MMFDTPWGATIPVRVRPGTIPDDAFEDRAEDELRRFFPRMHIERGRAMPRVAPVGRATYYRPDLVLYLAVLPAALMHTIADAKRRVRLTKADVDRIADYRDNCGGGRAVIYIPRPCRVTRGGLATAARREVVIERRSW